MTDRPAFAAGMALLGVTFGREVDQARIAAYWSALSDLTDDEFRLATAKLCAGWKCQPSEMFPLPATIRQYARPYQDIAAEATRLFEQVEALGDYSPIGMKWSIAKVGAILGWAAAEAFAAAGGSSAFATLTDQSRPFVRKEFVAAYQRAAEAVAKRLAPPLTDRPALPAPRGRLRVLTSGIGDGPRRDYRNAQAGDDT